MIGGVARIPPTVTEPVDFDAEVSAFLARFLARAWRPKSPDMMPPSSPPGDHSLALGRIINAEHTPFRDHL